MGTIAYSRPGDNIGSTATITASAANSAYPAVNLCNLDVSNPAKLTTTSGSWVLDFGTPVTLQGVAILNHNLDAGLDVVWQGHTADSWADPDYEVAFTVPTDEADGFSVNPWLNLSAAAHTYRYWRLLIDEANSANVAVGELVTVAALRALPHDYQVAAGLEKSEEMPDIIHESGFGGRSVYSVGAKWKLWDGGMVATTPDDHWALARESRGRVRPWLFVPDRDVNAAFLVTFDWTGPQIVLRQVSGSVVAVPAFRLREVSRGVPL